MANLTLSIDEDVLQRARMRALERRTTVNALVREYLENFAGENPANRAVAAFLQIADSVHASSGPNGHSWSRQDLYGR
jgi:Arc/MetJ family transcription regulator